MGYMKRVTALLLALVMSLCLVFSASAATSPTTSPTATPTDTTATQTGVEVIPSSTDSAGTVSSVKSDVIDTVTFTTVANAAVTVIGDGTNPVFPAVIKTVNIDSAAAEVTTKAKSFKGSNVKTVNVNCASIRIKKNTFKGTKNKNLVIKINNAKKASDVHIGKGSTNGLSKKAKIIVSKTMSKKQFKKLKAKLKRKGFKGKIVRK